jgi:hypothetical protein
MSETEEQFEPISEAEARHRIATAFSTLDAIYNLHGPKNTEQEVWECRHCDIPWPCETEELILMGLDLANGFGETGESESPSA